ncbi:choline-phosphate cytidylyltransferase [Elasticomyces elasticus]|uniref:choline-phosphate cytidylyltransferase n=1 Tax=Elasticomyces elasticus TaxID=574655 RepID=A0AAN8A3E5_9PEZI|nr:choline-phosphate cytidylyltransferase [Elasticomyces elasticus]KAK4977107.1 choline-phosphate cytidylyltransferase [Elasticomyces elasticus]KAK5701639.1 choline-phosphate cytidylyltransferase [Elasticomyces elasticus]KAK5724736.1 choline-phosphate cytidylyltransferase [Elasticomyces elasticus]
MAPKRKRAGTASNETAQDASSDGAVDASLENNEIVKPLDPPAKRTRSAKVDTSNGNEQEKPQGRARAGSKVEMPANGAEEGAGENGEAGTMRMAPPPPAGSIDPKGYKTNPPPQGRSVRVYADGVFDMFHLGHMRVLQQAKTAFPDTYLIVGVTGEAETHKRKGLTVMSAKERAESLRHCRWVDEVIEDCPWILNMDFLEKNNIDYVAHDDEPYGASEGDDIYKPIKERGMFLVTQRTEGVSTTGIITKIVRDYEQYVSRQLKRGTKRQELNISWLKKNELDIKRNVAELRNTIRQNWTTTGQEVSRELRQFWQPSRPNSPAPSLLNGTPGRVGARSPSSLLDPMQANGTPQRDPKTTEFMAGYAMGLVGSVKGWMEASRRRNLSDSRQQSPNGSESEDSGNKSPDGEQGSVRRGRQGKKEIDAASEQLEDEMDS